MIREILSPQSPRRTVMQARPRFKRPFHLVTSLVRALDIDIPIDPEGAFGLLYEMILMGHYPFGWHAPNGYPDTVQAWGSNLVPRWAYATRLLDYWVYHAYLDIEAIQTRLRQTGKPWAQAIDLLLTGGAMRSQDVDRVHTFLTDKPLFTERTLREAIGLAACSPSYQFY